MLLYQWRLSTLSYRYQLLLVLVALVEAFLFASSRFFLVLLVGGACGERGRLWLSFGRLFLLPCYPTRDQNRAAYGGFWLVAWFGPVWRLPGKRIMIPGSFSPLPASCGARGGWATVVNFILAILLISKEGECD